MRIAIVTTQCPFVTGGAELHAEQLKLALRRAGHEAEMVSIPYKWYPPESILDHMLAARNFDISEYNGVKIDLAICLKFPAYLMQHPNKVYWILHQERAAYDLWDSGLSDFFHSDNGQMVRAAVRQADDEELSKATRIFANSKNVAKRLLHYNGIEAEALYHPPPLAERLHGGAFGSYFYYPSRITQLKRQEFVLRSLAQTKTNAKVIFSGAFDSADYEEKLKRLTHDLGLDDRVEWRGFVSDDDMIELYSGARGVLYTPIDEDLGYVALEAMAAGKPLITLGDAGEPANLVRHECEGLVCGPETDAYASLLDRAMGYVETLRTLGEAARGRYESLDISWEKAVAKLIAPMTKKTALHQPKVMSIKASSFHEPKNLAVPNAAKKTHLRLSSAAQGICIDASLEDLFKRYDFGASLDHARSYLKTHWRRYQKTLEILREIHPKPRRILDLGISPPFIFTALLKEIFPDAEFFGVQERPAGYAWVEKVISRNKMLPDIAVSLAGLNIETSPLPFEDQSFDLVLGMEILEHFAIDPSFVFREVARVMRPRGSFLITSPNLVSWGAIHRALRGDAPYSFGVFVPWNGVYGRHNREYVPREVEELGLYAGFDTNLLETADVYDQEEVPQELSAELGQQFSTELRGQNIFYLGCKQVVSKAVSFPKSLYVSDPALFEGHLEITRGANDVDLHIAVTNKSPLRWKARGDNCVQLCVDRIDQSGFVVKNYDVFSLPHDLDPQEKAEIIFSVNRGAGTASAWFEIGLYLQGVGAFKEAGRTNTVSVFAEKISIEADGGLKCA